MGTLGWQGGTKRWGGKPSLLKVSGLLLEDLTSKLQLEGKKMFSK